VVFSDLLALVTSFKLEDETVRRNVEFIPEHPTLTAYVYMLTHSNLLTCT